MNLEKRVYINENRNLLFRHFENICEALDIQPDRTSSKMSDQIINECVLRRPLIVIDEIGEIALKGDLIGTLRSITDVAQLNLLAVGDEKTLHKLKRNAPVFSRISEFAEFTNATENDVRILCTELAEVDISDDLVAHIHAETGGNFREIMNSIARIERAMKRNKGSQITASMVKGLRLTNDGRSRARLKTRAA